MQEVAKYKHCFVCGDQNPIGLKARFYFDGTQAVTEVDADRIFEGYKGIFHGGIIATLLDEVMIKALLAKDIFAVTAEMTVKFKRPVRTGDKIKFVGRETGHRGRLYETEGEALGSDGVPFATATGKYLEAKPALKAELSESLD